MLLGSGYWCCCFSVLVLAITSWSCRKPLPPSAPRQGIQSLALASARWHAALPLIFRSVLIIGVGVIYRYSRLDRASMPTCGLAFRLFWTFRRSNSRCHANCRAVRSGAWSGYLLNDNRYAGWALLDRSQPLAMCLAPRSTGCRRSLNANRKSAGFRSAKASWNRHMRLIIALVAGRYCLSWCRSLATHLPWSPASMRDTFLELSVNRHLAKAARYLCWQWLDAGLGWASETVSLPTS